MGLELNLRAEGFDVLVAHDGDEGLTLARSGKVDLVILDVMLPKVNGFEVLRALKSRPKCGAPITTVRPARSTTSSCNFARSSSGIPAIPSISSRYVVWVTVSSCEGTVDPG